MTIEEALLDNIPDDCIWENKIVNCPQPYVYQSMQAYADQEKRKEAIEFADWIQTEGHLDMTQGLLHLADPAEKLYDLYLQYLQEIQSLIK